VARESEERARPFAQNAKESGTPESRTIEYATRRRSDFPTSRRNRAPGTRTVPGAAAGTPEKKGQASNDGSEWRI